MIHIECSSSPEIMSWLERVLTFFHLFYALLYMYENELIEMFAIEKFPMPVYILLVLLRMHIGFSLAAVTIGSFVVRQLFVLLIPSYLSFCENFFFYIYNVYFHQFHFIVCVLCRRMLGICRDNG